MKEAQDPDTPVVDRREDHAEWRANVDKRLDDGAATMRKLREDLKANTDTTNLVQTNTSEVVDLLRSFQGAFKVFTLIGKAAKPLSYIAMACTAVLGFWTALKGGGAPK